MGELNSGDFKGCGEGAIFRYLPSFTTNVLNTRKTRNAVWGNSPGVRIPNSPPQSSAESFCRALFALVFRWTESGSFVIVGICFIAFTFIYTFWKRPSALNGVYCYARANPTGHTVHVSAQRASHYLLILRKRVNEEILRRKKSGDPGERCSAASVRTAEHADER